NDPHVKIIEQKERGYGRAYQKGFEHASGDYIVTFDADQTYPAEAIPKLLSKIDDEQIDFLNTNRLQKFEKGAFPKMNYFGNKMFSLFCRLFLRMPFKDSQSGMWFFRKSLLNKLNCIQSGMEFSTEIKIKASRVGKCAEEVIYYRKRESEGTLRWFHDGKRIAKYLLKEFWYTLRGKEMEK
ncbi:MAG: glycosyltransferase family 2 protein, partial [Asgard group archaeon]|nr:glycosyltransferase family 2 protein [Asgard group archaeon]